MEHLTPTRLAELVDECPSTEEVSHLRECGACRSELLALRGQTRALRSLPDLVPPSGGWSSLESRLEHEGLIAPQRPVPNRWGGVLSLPAGWTAVAALLLILLGGVAGEAIGSRSPIPSERPGVQQVLELATPEEAAAALREAEMRYIYTRARFEELVHPASGGTLPRDMYTRYATRYALLAPLARVTEEALRRAPDDPFFNGLHVSVSGEREATAARLTSAGEVWY